MKLREALKAYKGKDVKIGAAVAFLYCNTVIDNTERELEELSEQMGIWPLLERQVIKDYESLEELNEGHIFIVTGVEHGKYWSKKEYLAGKGEEDEEDNL